ncbi:hypothetical protein N9Y48_00110 [Zobellia sp.]|nr:hypothetical protein [Zobellia sp.]
MKRIFFFSLMLFTSIGCKEQKQELVVEDVYAYDMDSENWAKKLFIKPKAQDMLREWKEFTALETSFDALFTVVNREDLRLVIEDMIADYDKLEKSKYPVEFDIPQVKSRQKVFKTYMLKAKGDLFYRIDPQESVVQMIEAYNAFRNQFNVVVSNTLDTELILDF